MSRGNADLEALASAIIALSNRREERSELCSLLTENSTLIDSRPVALLSFLSFREHAFACLYVLWSWKPDAAAGADSEWFLQATRFLKQCDAEELTSFHQKFLAVAKTVKKHALSAGVPQLAVLPLRHAVQKFAPSPDTLTPLHADFFQLCILSHHYAAAKDLLFTEIFEMNPNRTLLTPTDFLLYCYYGGRLCIGLKEHQRALEFFHLALVAPTLASNAITLMVYKLYVLVSLLELGEVPDLPRYSSSAVMRLTRVPSISPYVRLSTAYQTAKREEVEKVVRDCREAFEEDKCYGLIKQVLASLPARDVKSLTQSYVTRSVADTAVAVGLKSEAETEDLILRLAQDRQISALVSGMKRMVTFVESPEMYDDAEMTEELDEMMRKVMELSERMQQVKDKIELDPEYRSKVLQSKQHSKLDC